MKLVEDDVAEYRSDHGIVIKYSRRDGSKQVEMCQ